MAETKDMYVLGQSKTGSIIELGEEIKIDLDLEPSSQKDVGTVFGTVTDPQGNPVENATIKVTDNLYNPLYHRNTDSNGQYTINNIPADKQYEIFAQKDLYDLGVGTAFIMQEEQTIERDFALQPSEDANTAIVAGDILDREGNKVADVTVSLYDNSQPESPVLLKTTHSNQYGQFAFFYIPSGFYKVEFKHLGYKTTSSTFVVDSEVKIVNLEISMEIDPVTRKGTINGIIRDDNDNPIAGAFVVLYEVTEESGEEILTPIRKTVTNVEGLYLFEQVEEGDYKIKANKTEVIG